MNYIQILKDSLHLFRTTKLIWVFGAFSLIFTIPLNSLPSARDNPVLACIYLPIFIALFLLEMTATGSLYYAIHQASLNKNAPFPKAWSQGKSKTLRNCGLIVLSIPILLIWGLFIRVMTVRTPASPLLWLVFLAGNLLITPFFTFGFCAVAISNVKVLAAAWTSLHITVNNFLRVSVITGVTFLVRLLITASIVVILTSGLFGAALPVSLTLDYPTYQRILAIPVVSWTNWFFNLFLFPLEAIMLTFAYLKFTEEVIYPALAERQSTA